MIDHLRLLSTEELGEVGFVFFQQVKPLDSRYAVKMSEVTRPMT
jgi:hypothetical protein